MLPPIVLLLREPHVKERLVRFEERRGIRIGSEAGGSELTLSHPSITEALNVHLVRQSGELLLVSYASAVRVTVNGSVVNQVAVVHGDEIKIGDVVLVVVSETKLDPREQALVDDIVRDPSDEMSRAVYADWLEENGFSDRAEYLRLDARIHEALRGAWTAEIREDVALLTGTASQLPPAWLALMTRKRKHAFPS